MVVEKKNLMRQPTSKKPVTGADFESAFRGKDAPAKKQLTLKIDEDLHRKVKMVAAERGVTITELVSGFIREL